MLDFEITQLQSLTGYQRALVALAQSVYTRSVGFNLVDFSAFLLSQSFLLSFLCSLLLYCIVVACR